jgi:hypothetical protein
MTSPMFAAENRQRSILRAAAEHLCRSIHIISAVLTLATPGRAEDSGSIEDRPLAAHAFPKGSTMFSLRPAEETGIRTENRYADPKMWKEYYHEFVGGSLGTGIAIGDYDGDGRADVFVVSKTETCRLFRNLGKWKFEAGGHLCGRE